ncbi:hypothetical protein I6F07_03765 [Ensifer sp. IC4062]|nr:hypothetical protein [Ensifer sp. IC4062]MCA1439352.1 hypothetical protein [Ensifer sp. IC4062]
MRTLEDEINNTIAVDLAVMKPFERRAFAGLNQYGRKVEVRGIQQLAVKMAESFQAYAIFDDAQVLRYPAITPFITQTLYTIPIELRRDACDLDRQKASEARDRMARLISGALTKRYRFEPLKHIGTSSHGDWDAAFEAQFGSQTGKNAAG